MQISLLNERITFQRNVIAVGMMNSPAMRQSAAKAARKRPLWEQLLRIRIFPLLSVGALWRRLSAPQATALCLRTRSMTSFLLTI